MSLMSLKHECVMSVYDLPKWGMRYIEKKSLE